MFISLIIDKWERGRYLYSCRTPH